MTESKRLAQKWADLEQAMRAYADKKYNNLSFEIWQHCVLRWNHWQGIADGQRTS